MYDLNNEYIAEEEIQPVQDIQSSSVIIQKQTLA